MKKMFLDTRKIKDFTKSCLKNESAYDYKGSVDIVKKYWHKAKNIEEFKKLVLEDERLENNQGYWQLAKESSNYIDLVLKYLEKHANESFTTISDIGSLTVGNRNFRYNIPNLYGDGTNTIYIFDNKINLECLNFLTTISGKFNIYEYDCGNDVAKKLNGVYAIYRIEKIFAFVKWNN